MSTLQETEEGTALGKSSKSLQGALGGDLAGSMTRSLLQALRSGGSAGQCSAPRCNVVLEIYIRHVYTCMHTCASDVRCSSHME